MMLDRDCHALELAMEHRSQGHIGDARRDWVGRSVHPLLRSTRLMPIDKEFRSSALGAHSADHAYRSHSRALATLTPSPHH